MAPRGADLQAPCGPPEAGCLGKFWRIPTCQVLGCREVIRIRKQFTSTSFCKRALRSLVSLWVMRRQRMTGDPSQWWYRPCSSTPAPHLALGPGSTDGAMEALVSGTSVEGIILVWPLRRESVWRTDKEPKLRAGNRASGTEPGPEISGHLCVTRALQGGVDAGGLRETGRD